MNKNTKQFIALFLFIFLPLLVGYLSAQLSGVSFSGTYSQLNKPVFSPPAWIFAPVWTILYILMGISAYLVWKERERMKIRNQMAFFFIQLVLNFFWSIIFFGMGNYLWALIEIVVLLVAVTIMIITFFKVSKTAAYLLLPYLFWVGFATILNFTVWLIN